MLRVAVRFRCLKSNSLGGIFSADLTNPISNLTLSSRYFQLLFSQYNLSRSAVFLTKAVAVSFSSVGILWCLGARWAVKVRTLGATSSRFMLGIQQYIFHVTIINKDGGWNAAPIAIAEVQFYPGA